MGAVHRARRLADGLEVAIKQPLEDADAVRFQIEARLLERLRHPRVVRVIDHFRRPAAGDYLVGWSWCAGASLRRGLARAQRPAAAAVSDAVEHIRQACEALAYVHEQQVVHRDVKPANLILARATASCSSTSGSPASRAPPTRPRGRSAPRGYAAPEVLSGTAATSRSA